MRRLEYVASPKHGLVSKGNISAAPVNGQEALDTSVLIKQTSPRRVGIDYHTKDFVVFDKTIGSEYHGHVRSWNELTNEMQQALVNAGMVNRRGNFMR